MSQNLCHFVPSPEVETDICILNFVYERNWRYTDEMMKSSHMLCLVTAGRGRYVTTYGSFPLGEGDIFVVFSAKPYSIHNEDGLEYCYITFTGARLRPLLSRLNVKVEAPVLRGFGHLTDYWLRSLGRVDARNGELIARAVLYHTLSYMLSPVDASAEGEDGRGARDVIPAVKRYLDEHFREGGLSLSSVAGEFGYHPKYLSEKFKRTVGVTVTEYVTERRIRHAEHLIEEGCFSVAQIAEACGYSDPLYFSRVYKKAKGYPPSRKIGER